MIKKTISYTAILILLSSLIGCNQQNLIKNNSNNMNNTQNEYVIFPSDYEIQKFPDKKDRFTPNETEIEEASRLLKEYLGNKEETEEIKELKGYKVQYFGYINNDNQKTIWANYFCNSFNGYDWKKNLVFVFDGGNCFFNVKVNLDKKEVFDFYVNGEA